MSEIEGLNANNACQATHEEICNKALEHYNKISDFACSWISTIPHAIAFYKKYKDHISTLEEKIRELTVERDSETRWAKEYFDKWEKAESRLKELQEAVDKHKEYMWGEDVVDHSADKELYRTKNEI